MNVPADYPYADFQDLYLQAWRSGLKGLATYRPNAVLGSVLSVAAGPADRPAAADAASSANQRLPLDKLPAAGAGVAALAGPPRAAGRQPGVELHGRHPFGDFALFVGELPADAGPTCLFGKRCRSRSG